MGKVKIGFFQNCENWPFKFKLPYLGGEVSSEWRTQATEKVFWAYFLGWVQLGPYGP